MPNVVARSLNSFVVGWALPVQISTTRSSEVLTLWASWEYDIPFPLIALFSAEHWTVDMVDGYERDGGPISRCIGVYIIYKTTAP